MGRTAYLLSAVAVKMIFDVLWGGGLMNAKPFIRWGIWFSLLFLLVTIVAPEHNQKVFAKPLADQFFNCATQTQISETECDALLAFYDSTNGEDWTEDTGWLLTDTPCSWKGVHCNAESQVDGLDLTSNHLTGTLPPAINDLVHLVILQLGHNQITGVIPPGLGNLSNLTYFAIPENLLSGTIPPELGNLVKLDTLYLIGNQLSGLIPPELGNLTNLTFLSLGFNQLTGSIPVELGNLAKLRWLFLNHNQLSGSIPAELGNLINLEFLYLDNNQLSSIPAQFGNLTKLNYLSLNHNLLNGPIPPELGSLANLETLFLNDSQLTGSIPAQIGNLTTLKYFTLAGNHLSGEFPSTIPNLNSLIYFTFDCWINSSDPGVIAFIDALVPGWQNNVCPIIISITPVDPTPTTADSVHFDVVFSSIVTGVTDHDFSLFTTGISAAHVVSIDGSGSVYIVSVNTGFGSGTIRLDLIDDDSIINALHNPLGGFDSHNGDFDRGGVYQINKDYIIVLPLILN